MAQAASELVIVPASRVPSLPPVRWKFILWLSVLTGLVGLVAASYLAYTGSVATSSYNLQRLQTEREQWQTRNAQLRVEVAKVRSLTWVEHEAVSRLKMQKPGQLTYLKLDAVAPAAAAEPGPSVAR